MFGYCEVDQYADVVRRKLVRSVSVFSLARVQTMIEQNGGKINFVSSSEMFDESRGSDRLYPITFLNDGGFQFNVFIGDVDTPSRIKDIEKFKMYRVVYLLGVYLLEMKDFNKSNDKVRQFYSSTTYHRIDDTQFLYIDGGRIFAECFLMSRFKVKRIIRTIPFSDTQTSGTSLTVSRPLISDKSRFVSIQAFSNFFNVPAEVVIRRLINLDFIAG